jgi:hypothetical protein
MKKLAAVIVCVLLNGFISISQKNEWRDKPEIQVFLLKIDSILEAKFGHPMEPFAEFEAGALNYVKNSFSADTFLRFPKNCFFVGKKRLNNAKQ